ncbi:transposase [Acinetobacter baumannii]|nr:transposase [Acinetobacter baumannii]KCY36017.1 putative transposase [Acinetobacter baumannii 1262761-105]OOT55429.1 transposase [Acinetobacter baumannii]OTM50965.1 transposase [Acinetobacter baumannii]OTU57364.1 transposase [Acinetobacter baumannii]
MPRAKFFSQLLQVDSVKKVIYLATSNAAKKWTMPIQNWRLAMNWFTIQFDDRLKDHL